MQAGLQSCKCLGAIRFMMTDSSRNQEQEQQLQRKPMAHMGFQSSLVSVYGHAGCSVLGMHRGLVLAVFAHELHLSDPGP